MKVVVDVDERYPVYSLFPIEPDYVSGGTVAEITDEEWAEYEAVTERFNAMQERLRGLYLRTGGKE